MNIKNKQLVYIVVRHDFTRNDVVVAVTADGDRADELAGEYTQQFLDRGYSKEEVYFYVACSTFYT